MATKPARKPLTVKPKLNLPLVDPHHKPAIIAVKPPPQAARVALVAIRPMPCASIADKELPGLKPYQPNHNMKPPTAAIGKLCPGGMPPPSRAKIRPIRGPKTMAPASEAIPPMVCTTVEPAKSRNPCPKLAKKLPFVPITANQPSGPQAQCPIIG